MSSIKFIDLFCGIGSFHHSLAALGWECVFACDIDEHCRATYEANYGLKPAGNICEVDVAKVPQFDVLCAGFPCQPFSSAGKHKGFKDERGNMFFQTMRFIEHHQPEVVMLENVIGLEKHDNGKTLKKIIELLEEQQYFVKKTVLLCSDFGIPQMRKRIFIVAMKSNFPDSLLTFKNKETPTLTDFLNANRPREDHLIFTKKDIAYTIRCGGKRSPIDDGHNWDGYYVKKPSKNEEFVYRISIKDCIKLQGFDDQTFKLKGPEKAHWKMVGNTIPTNLTHLVGAAVDNYLSQKNAKKIKLTNDE